MFFSFVQFWRKLPLKMFSFGWRSTYSRPPSSSCMRHVFKKSSDFYFTYARHTSVCIQHLRFSSTSTQCELFWEISRNNRACSSTVVAMLDTYFERIFDIRKRLVFNVFYKIGWYTPKIRNTAYSYKFAYSTGWLQPDAVQKVHRYESLCHLTEQHPPGQSLLFHNEGRYVPLIKSKLVWHVLKVSWSYQR